MANYEAYYDPFRFAEVYRPVLTQFTVDDADTCSKIIRTFVNASHFRLSAWRLNDKGLPDDGNRLVFQSRDANAVFQVVNTYRHSDVSQSHGEVFGIMITAPRYLSERALDALLHEIDSAVRTRSRLNSPTFLTNSAILYRNSDRSSGNRSTANNN